MVKIMKNRKRKKKGKVKMSGGPGLGLGSGMDKVCAERIKELARLPVDGCPEGDHSVVECPSKEGACEAVNTGASDECMASV
jgi:hypothetical protein